MALADEDLCSNVVHVVANDENYGKLCVDSSLVTADCLMTTALSNFANILKLFCCSFEYACIKFIEMV